MKPKLEEMGRLAMREEGSWWVAYYAMPNTMKDAIELARIQMALVHDWQTREMFLAMMRDALKAIIKEQTGHAPEFIGERRAPEHERSGKA